MAAAAPVLSDAQLAQFDELGFVLLDTDGLVSPAWLDEAEATWDRLKDGVEHPNNTASAVERTTDEGYARAVSHPLFEGAAKQILRSDSVRLIEDGPHIREPAATMGRDAGDDDFDAAKSWAHGCHIDWQVTESGFLATPRRDLCAIWMWLNDVPAERGAM